MHSSCKQRILVNRTTAGTKTYLEKECINQTRMSLISADQTAGGLTIQELPNLLKRWMAIQEEITTLNAEVKQRRTQSKALRDVILRIMDANKVVQLNVSKGSVIHKTREVKESMNQNAMLQHMKDFFQGDTERANALIQYLEEHRGTVVKHDLRIYTGSGGSDNGSAK
jgi:hypothetical protein